MSEGYRALRAGAAWLDLSARGKIFASGKDRARLLHAMTTNHVQNLTPGAGCYAFLLNAQGRIQGDVNLLCLEDRFLLDTEPETRARLYQHLKKYIIADDVTLDDVTDSFATLALEGPEAAAVLASLSAPVPQAEYSHLAWDGSRVERVSSTGEPGFRFFVPSAEKAALIRRLEAAGAVAASLDDARVVRLEHGKPRYGEDISDHTLPQETQQTHAIHFTKGCYLGQEIVERIRARGHVNRLLVSLEIESSEAPASGTKLQAAGQEMGEITSAALSPALGKVVALGYVRAPYAQKGTSLSAGEHAAKVV